MTTCETCHGEGVLLCEGPYCSDSSHDEPCKDCEGSGERMDKHNCPRLRACFTHPKTLVSKLSGTTQWGVRRGADSGFTTLIFDSFKEALNEANKTDKDL